MKRDESCFEIHAQGAGRERRRCGGKLGCTWSHKPTDKGLIKLFGGRLPGELLSVSESHPARCQRETTDLAG